MRIHRRWALLSLLVCATRVPAQERSGRVRGVVIDSLLGETLPGARIRLMPLGRTTQSDSSGRFVLDSVPAGEWSLTFTHPALDSIGVSGLATPVRVFAGASAVVSLGTPSFNSIRDRFCGGTPDSGSATVALGRIFTLDTSRVPVSIGVIWMRGDQSIDAPNPGTVRTIADGNAQVWIACGIPEEAWFIASVKDSLRSASAFIHMGPRRIAVHDLALPVGVGSVRGVVRDTAGRPVSTARISVVGTSLHAYSDATGVFVILEAPNGTLTLDVRAAGFAPWISAVLANDPLQIRLRNARVASAANPRGSDYLRLIQRHPRPGAQVFAGAELQEDSTALTVRPPDGTCEWWVDGRPVTHERFTALPRITWRALELYSRGEDAPPEFRGSGCPIALLWTAAADWE